ncbi:MAG: TSUP family transporter [Gammaproteobacteria bacterium WSBS_2016_MAG_OTU1]
MEFLPSELSAANWTFVVGAVLFAAVVRGFAGFGFSALSVALLAFIMPPAVVVPLVMMLEVAASIWLLPKARRDVDVKWLLPAAVGIFIGTPIGVALLAVLSPDIAQIAVYVVLTLFAALNFLQGRGKIRAIAAPPIVAGAIAGAANGIAAIAGIVAALFLLASERKAVTVRASLIALFFVSDLYALVWGGGLGLLQKSHVVLFGVAIVPLSIGVIIGGMLFGRLGGGKNYRLFASGLILCAAIIGLSQVVLMYF